MLLFCDSFDHYQTAELSEKYQQSTEAIIASPGRSGTGYCLELVVNEGGYVQRSFPNQSQLIAGVAFNPSELATSSSLAFVLFYDPGGAYGPTRQGSLEVNPSGGLEYHVTIDGVDTIIASSASGVIQAGIFQYVEVNVLFSPTNGSVAAQVNGEGVFSVTGVNTAPSGNSYASSVFLISANLFNYTPLFDDFYICNGIAPNGGFLGNVAVECLLPNGQGQFTQFTPVPADDTNWYCISQNPPNSDSYYVYSPTPGDIDLYTVPALPGSPSTVIAVQIVASARKDDAYTRVLGVGFGSSTSYAFNLGSPLTSSYVMFPQPYDINPVTNVGWQVSDFNSGQIGIQVIS